MEKAKYQELTKWNAIWKKKNGANLVVCCGGSTKFGLIIELPNARNRPIYNKSLLLGYDPSLGPYTNFNYFGGVRGQLLNDDV